MNRKCLLLCVVLVGLLGSAILPRAPLQATRGGIAGTVVQLVSGKPLRGVRVSAAGRGATTDVQGRYTLWLPAGDYEVRAEAVGFVGMTATHQRVEGNNLLSLRLAMIPATPTEEEERAIATRVMTRVQSAPDEHDREVWAQGFAPTVVAEVPRTLRVLMPDGTVVVMEMEEYLRGVVPHEMPPSWPREALRAQAVAARSYAATRHGHGDVADVCTTEHCQVWRPIYYDTTDRAIAETRGVVGTYAGHIIGAYFSAHCDGHTRNSEDVWVSALPYCRSVSCPCGFDTLYGHGVGMCQWGARALALQGQSYTQILKHYYTGIAVEAPSPGRISTANVTPLRGDERTQFTFEVAYTSAAGEAPAVANVIIDERAYPLLRVPGGTAQSWLYRLTTRLSQGTHTFRFCVDDGYSHVSRVPATGTFRGPVVEATNPAAPAPTPLPADASQALAGYIGHSTAADWASGSLANTRITSDGDGALALAEGRREGVYTSAVLSAAAPFVAAGLTWYGYLPSGSAVTWEVRRSTDGRAWEAWQPWRESEDGPTQAPRHANDLLLGLRSALQYRLTLRANASGESPRVEDVRLALLDTRPGLTASMLAQTAPAVITRAAWGADERLMTWPPEYRDVRAVILHHTATDDGGVDPAAVVRAIYYYHAVVLEWGDIGYNLLVDRLGNIYEGRYGGTGVVGGHAYQYNWGSLGVALVGNFQESTPSAPMLSKLTDLLAWRSAEHYLDPTATQFFVDQPLPVLMGHRDAQQTLCPGDRAYAQLPALRAQTLAKMALVPPHLNLAAPRDGQAVRGVVEVTIQASAAISRVDYYLDDALRESVPSAPFLWKWNTVPEAAGSHRLRVVAQNAAGQREGRATLTVDNTPPSGTLTAPTWVSSTQIALTLRESDATQAQFSNGWVWEGEALYHQVLSGRMVSDTAATNGLAWQGRVGGDRAGVWYGPYSCGIPAWRSYQALFRLKTPSRAITTELATLDVADDQGRRIYAQRVLNGADFPRENVYEEFALPFTYRDRWPACVDSRIDDGLEFRTAFRATGDLTLDRVAVFASPQPAAASLPWALRDEEGAQTLLVRLLDAAGNATERSFSITLDKTAPQWRMTGVRTVEVQDTLSGLNPATAAYALSSDGGSSWGSWQTLTLSATAGVTTPLSLAVPETAGALLRLRVADRAGNTSTTLASAPVWLPMIWRG